MSGVEVAGFVLGAFPLLISALEHYRQTAEVLSDWWQIKREYRKCKDEIRFHQLAFEQNLEKYLLPMIVDEEELQELIANPGGPQWRNPDLEEKLKERLPKAYDLFFSTILQMNDTMQELEKEIGGKMSHFQKKVSAEEEPRSASDDLVVEKKPKGRRKRLLSKPNLEYETQRIKFTFGRNERNKLFQEIAGYNARLKELLDTTDQISAIRGDRAARRGQKVSKGLMQFWRHATSVFKLVTEAFRCQCSSLHHVNLRLEHRSKPEVRFNLLFLFDQRNPLSSASPWNRMKTRVSLVEADTSPPPISRSVSDVAALKPGRPALKNISRTMSSASSATLV
jgi:hypothetical protein